MESAVTLYEEDCSLKSIADALALSPIKIRKLLITAGVYESEVVEKVQDTFEEYRETQNYKDAILLTANALQLSKTSVTSYLTYEKGVYFPSTEKEKISVGAECREDTEQWSGGGVIRQKKTSGEWFWPILVCAWKPILACHLPMKYESVEWTIHKRNVDWQTREKQELGVEFCATGTGEYKKGGRSSWTTEGSGWHSGVTYIYGMFYRFGMIDVPEEVKEEKNDWDNKKRRSNRK